VDLELLRHVHPALPRALLQAIVHVVVVVALHLGLAVGLADALAVPLLREELVIGELLGDDRPE
jgi:hypothetical protein